MLERFSDETTLRRATTDDSVTRATRAPPPPPPELSCALPLEQESIVSKRPHLRA
jgi:hypothetical protein